MEPDGTFSIAGGSVVTQSTPLAPFNDATGRQFWTSNAVRRTETFNYAYPETQRWNYRTEAEYINSVQDNVAQLYGGVSRNLRQGGGFDTRTTGSSAPVTDEAVRAPPNITNQSAKPANHQISGFLHDIGHKLKEAVSGNHSTHPAADATRELNLEAEIGKRRSPCSVPAVNSVLISS